MREHTKRSSTSELSDSDANGYINDFYRYRLTSLISLDRFDTTWKKTATVDDDGEYSTDNDGNSLVDVIEIKGPVYANGLEMTVIFGQGSGGQWCVLLYRQ